MPSRGSHVPGPNRLLFSKTANPVAPPYSGSAVLSLVKEGAETFEGVSSFDVPRMRAGHYYVVAQCAGEPLPCCAIYTQATRGWFTVQDAPDTAIAPVPDERGREIPWLPVFIAAVAWTGGAAWRIRVGRKPG